MCPAEVVKCGLKNELQALLERAGFAILAVEADYTGEPAGADDTVLVFVARKG